MYNVPQYIDNNKVFIVKRSEIDGRIDPHYNKPEYKELYELLESLQYKLSTLKEESYAIFSGITPKSGGDAYSTDSDAIPFVRSGDFSETNTIDFSKLLYLKPEVHNGIMSASKLKKNDLLVAIVGATIGKIGIYLYDREANINQAICGIRLKDHLSPFYVQAFYQTSIGQKIIERSKRPVARANLNLDEVGRFPIPLVDEVIQQKVIDKLQEGINNKLKKESEAQKLLDGIDSYLLKELGIILPTTDYSLEKRMFYISSGECVDKRIDPKKYSPKTKDLYQAIENSIFPKSSLANFIIDSCSGDWGNDGEVDNVPSGWTKCVVLRGTEFDNSYNLSISQDKVKQRLIQTEKFDRIRPLLNDIIIEKSGGSDDQPVGRVAIIDTDNYNNVPLSFSNFLMKIRVSGIDAYYLYYYLRTMYNIGVTDSMQSQTNGIRNLIIKEFLEQKVVVPSFEKQRDIATHIAEMRSKAKSLQEEGRSILENAKKEVERIIIG